MVVVGKRGAMDGSLPYAMPGLPLKCIGRSIPRHGNYRLREEATLKIRSLTLKRHCKEL